MNISAIIPAYNAAPFLRRAVESLLKTDFPDLEIIVVDDGSTDSTWKIACALRDQNPGKVAVYRHADEGNHGVSESRNLGILKSSGELICFLDADDYVLPRRFKTSVPLLSSDVQIDGVYELSRVEMEEKGGSDGIWRDGGAFGIQENVEPRELLRNLLRGQTWAISAILFRRSLLNQAGLFRTDLKIAEDCNLWFRMVCAGRIVAGDLRNPVSVYCRHSKNAYRYEPCRKLDMIRAMVDAYLWVRKEPNCRCMQELFLHGVRDYIQNAIITAREMGDHKLGWDILKLLLRERGVRFCFNQAILKQVVALAQESIATSSAN
ncbi:MAG: glycosyltransferase [Acidobacteriia bacterium]|nr:glycosyltransferase [Terriglobia bacterium]